MSLGLLASERTTVRQVKGSFDPFGGWGVVGRIPTAAHALLIDQPADRSWSIAVWCLDAGSAKTWSCPRESPTGQFSGDEDWTVSIPTRPSPLTIRRQGQSIRLEEPGRSSDPQVLSLVPGADTSADRLRVRQAYAEVIAKYPRFRDIESYRLRVSYAVIVILALQEILFALVRPAAARLFRFLVVLGWLGLGGWLTLFYLR
jgi:hypothetical protein